MMLPGARSDAEFFHLRQYLVGSARCGECSTAARLSVHLVIPISSIPAFLISCFR